MLQPADDRTPIQWPFNDISSLHTYIRTVGIYFNIQIQAEDIYCRYFTTVFTLMFCHTISTKPFIINFVVIRGIRNMMAEADKYLG